MIVAVAATKGGVGKTTLAVGLAEALAARGDGTVVLVDLDRQAEKGEALAKQIGGAFVPCDVRNTEQVQAAVDAAVEMAPISAAGSKGGATRKAPASSASAST